MEWTEEDRKKKNHEGKFSSVRVKKRNGRVESYGNIRGKDSEWKKLCHVSNRCVLDLSSLSPTNQSESLPV